jgi:raffinose/stachyose/melibiose transport system permease protein
MYRYTHSSALRELGFWLGALIIAAPVYLLVVLSLKSPQEASETPLAPPNGLYLDNYKAAWDGGGGTATFGEALINSFVTTAAVVALVIILGAPAGYALARRVSRVSGGLFWVFVVGLILPAQLGFLPLFVFLTNIGLGGSQLGLILVFVGQLLPVSVFLYTGFCRGLPEDYEQAASVDGASRLRTFFQIVLPLMRPVTGTVAILIGMFTWNDFFTPLIFVGGTDHVTLPVALQSFVGQFVTQWNLIFAGVVIALAPVLLFYLLSQKYVIRGFTSGVRG